MTCCGLVFSEAHLLCVGCTLAGETLEHRGLVKLLTSAEFFHDTGSFEFSFEFLEGLIVARMAVWYWRILLAACKIRQLFCMGQVLRIFFRCGPSFCPDFVEICGLCSLFLWLFVLNLARGERFVAGRVS